MNTFLRFFYEFVSIFFDGLVMAFKGLLSGLQKMFNIPEYSSLISDYKANFNGPEWVFVALLVLVLVIIFGLIAFLIFLFIKKVIRRANHKLNKDELLEEIATLDEKVKKLMKEKDEIMAMKVSQLGLNPNEPNTEETSAEETENQEGSEVDEENPDSIRFPKLVQIDEELRGSKIKNYGNNYTLEELLENFRCFSASKLHLYYDATLLRPFFAGLACGKLIILQGISGTGKTSLAYAWGKFVKNDSCLASVQPSWKDKTELLGYFNEFTKKFNETEVLAELYRASFDDNVHTIILDEMNIARVEYYFAEMLSVLEIPSRDEWNIELVTSGWPKDPERIKKGKLHLPGNLWYIGTINNDDSTYMVTDKVYDRAMPIDIDTKIDPYKCREQDAMDINSSYLEGLFTEAIKEHAVSEESLEKVRQLDDYVISHFRVAFGNRIMKQLNVFTAVYVACGGKEIEGIDYFIAKKIFRKFEQLNLSFIRDELDPFISYLNKNFGKNKMKECIAYIERIKKSI